ncbi:MAG: S-methyl-5-thioribose-1-phosphate isomerase [Gammaproteobacteria bacterium]|nr:S-methyl-5-thioribose-1-phosphate isomerase [Gammaproteobacteria bacterium]MCY4356792.1 S-methyl-5-thioribose-1-phosphate isomerase [Gammaproteobacteria bacterium]
MSALSESPVVIDQVTVPRSLCYDRSLDTVWIINQTQLPYALEQVPLKSLEDCCHAIRSMQVRGAPLIGVTAAYGVYLALREDCCALEAAINELSKTRPTAVNLSWALQRCRNELSTVITEERAEQALALAQRLEAEDIAVCAGIGDQGLRLLEGLWQSRAESQERLNILTHCNAGALAAVDWGTALAVVYKAAAAELPVHVWVDETRPRNQGAALTCWELAQRKIPHTLIVDNVGGHLMQRGQVDVCLVGSDRTTRRGDVCNKIGTYLKALAAHDNDIPFYVALPVSSIDFACMDAHNDIPIEERSGSEVLTATGRNAAGELQQISLAPEATPASNYGFDITPARLVTGLITEKGVVSATESGIASLID